MLVLGLGLGFVMQVLVLAVQNAVPYAQLGIATSSATLFRSIGGSLGTAILGAIFSNRLATSWPRSCRRARRDVEPDLRPGQPGAGAVAAAGAARRLRAVVHRFPLDRVRDRRRRGGRAFLLAWTLEERPLRRTIEDRDLGDALPPPQDTDSLSEITRELSRCVGRDRTRRFIERVIADADVDLTPAEGVVLARSRDGLVSPAALVAMEPDNALKLQAGLVGLQAAGAGRARRAARGGDRGRRRDPRTAARGARARPAFARRRLGARGPRRRPHDRPPGRRARASAGARRLVAIVCRRKGSSPANGAFVNTAPTGPARRSLRPGRAKPSRQSPISKEPRASLAWPHRRSSRPPSTSTSGSAGTARRRCARRCSGRSVWTGARRRLRRRAARCSARQRRGRRVPGRLPDREVALARQPLRVRGAVRVLRGARESERHRVLVLRHRRRDRAARRSSSSPERPRSTRSAGDLPARRAAAAHRVQDRPHGPATRWTPRRRWPCAGCAAWCRSPPIRRRPARDQAGRQAHGHSAAAALAMVAVFDVMFAIDSIPAIFADHARHLHRVRGERLQPARHDQPVLPARRAAGPLPLPAPGPGGDPRVTCGAS